jgi:DNA-binding MarR family transcriptional regulator
MATSDFDHGAGVRINEVSKILHVDPSFVTTQSKLLEKQGYLRRRVSAEDRRVVQLSLTEKALRELSKLRSQKAKIVDFIFSDFGVRETEKLLNGLSILADRLQKASLVASLKLTD